MNLKRTYFFTAAFTALSLALVSCGGDGTQQGVGTVTNSGFRITASTPSQNQFQVPLNTNFITVRFSQPIDASTLPGSYSLFIDSNGSLVDITSQVTGASTDSSGSATAVFSLSGGLQVNTNYRLEVRSSLKALTTGASLPVSDLIFSTGVQSVNGGGFQFPGVAPKVQSVFLSTLGSGGGCFSEISFFFSEDLARAPIVRISRKALIGGWTSVPVPLQSSFNGRLDQWVLPVSSYWAGGAWTKYRVEIEANEVVDLQGEVMENKYPTLDADGDVDPVTQKWEFNEPVWCVY